MSTDRSLGIDDFAALLGCAVDAIPDDCRALIAKGDWGYQALPQAERDALILRVIQRIDRKEMSIVQNEDKSRWQRGWGENLDAFVTSGGDLGALVPRYVRPGVPIRLNGDFARTADPNFELHWFEVFRLWLYRTYLAGFDHIFEFGAGSGYNVAVLAELFPDATITGLDWSEASCEIVERLRTDRGLRTRGRHFDFFHPDETLDFPPNSAVLTICALEQTADRNGPFLDFLLRKRPALCVNIEPIVDWYDPDSLVDHLAIRAHEVRNFLSGYWQRLRALSDAGQVEILKAKRANLGSLLHEGYSQLIWRPAGR